MDVFRIKIASCPLGFALNTVLQICQCDPMLKLVVLSAESCNIDALTVLRPAASSWITGRINADTITLIKCPYIVHLTIVYLTPHTSTSPILTLNVSLTELLFCVEDVKKISVLCLVLLSVNNTPITICFFFTI